MVSSPGAKRPPFGVKRPDFGAKRSVLFVVTTLDVGGAEKHLLWLAEGLAGRGWRVDVAFLKGEGVLAERFRALGASVRKIPFERPAQLAPAVRGLAALIRAGGYDVVHTHLLKADVLGALAARMAKHPALVSSKHNQEAALRKKPVALVHGLISRLPRRIVALSDFVLEDVASVGRAPRAKLRRVYYGIDPDRLAGGDRDRARAEFGAGPGTHVALCVARFHPQKDHATLLRAAARLAAKGRDFVLLLAGDDPFGDNRQRTEALAKDLGLGARVRFLGIRHDVADLLAGCDLFVLPSLYEGLGLVYLEAMAAERPVLATRSSAIPEVVTEGVTGRLVPVGDDDALARAWMAFMDEPERSRAMGRAGRERVLESFTLPRMIDEMLAVYEEALAARD